MILTTRGVVAFETLLFADSPYSGPVGDRQGSPFSCLRSAWSSLKVTVSIEERRRFYCAFRDDLSCYSALTCRLPFRNDHP